METKTLVFRFLRQEAQMRGRIPIEFVEKRMKLEHKSKVEVKIDLTLDSEGEGYLFHPSVFVAMPGRDEALAREILEAAERQCPVHKLLKGVTVPPVELSTANE